MLKVIFCLKRLPHLSDAQFQDYWRHQHGPLVQRIAPTLNIRRYTQSATLHGPALAAMAELRGSAGLGYDGVAEIWWDDLPSLMTALGSAEGQAATAALLADEANFIDLPKSPIFFANEHVLVG